MNFGCRFLLLILLIISLQSSSTFAVLCPSGGWKPDDPYNAKSVTFDSNDMKNCSTCVLYFCNPLLGSPLAQKGGCPEDYYKDCAARDISVDYIKTNGSNILEYIIDGETGYYSGCSKYCNGTECIIKKYLRFADDLENDRIPEVLRYVQARLAKDPKGMSDDICDLSVLSTTTTTKQISMVTDTTNQTLNINGTIDSNSNNTYHILSDNTTPKRNATSDTTDQNPSSTGDPNASKGQNGTMKNIGIFLIGFIFAASWIY